MFLKSTGSQFSELSQEKKILKKSCNKVIFSRSTLTHEATSKHSTFRMLEEKTISYVIAKETQILPSKIWFSKSKSNTQQLQMDKW